jgi:hypothetical protein
LRSLSRKKDALRWATAMLELLRQIHEGTQAFKVRNCAFVDQLLCLLYMNLANWCSSRGQQVVSPTDSDFSVFTDVQYCVA